MVNTHRNSSGWCGRPPLLHYINCHCKNLIGGLT
nr:MAG TPA: hypothetical protein [Caudoviricetes sp.]DAT79226.1 MAG TPA: hypothetical protein [Caudoviricetes sp.]